MRAASLQAARLADAPAKLELLERLLGVRDVGDCIDHALAWLVARTHATQAICVLADADTNQLRGVAGHRVPAAQVEALIGR